MSSQHVTEDRIRSIPQAIAVTSAVKKTFTTDVSFVIADRGSPYVT